VLRKKQIGESHGSILRKIPMAKITNFLNNCFDFEILLDKKEISYYLAKVSKCNSYVETLGKHADSLHKWIKSSYEEDFLEAFLTEVSHAIKKIRISIADLAIDVTPESFYGKTRNLHTINCEKNKKHSAEFRFVNCHLINKGRQIPVACLPVRYGNTISQTIKLIAICNNVFRRIRSIRFDRGFYSSDLIYFLKCHQIKYLIFVPKRGNVLKEYLNSTEKFSIFQHNLMLNKNKRKYLVQTNILACKDVCDYDWLFTTNIKFKSAEECVYFYKRRWQIETNFRVEDEAKIKSKSCNYMIRYFYHLCSALFRLCWIIFKRTKVYVQFKKFLDQEEQRLFFEIHQIDSIL
jgi:hypothetical protein